MGQCLKKCSHYIINSLMSVGFLAKEPNTKAREIVDYLLPNPEPLPVNVDPVIYDENRVVKFVETAKQWTGENEIIGSRNGYTIDLSPETEKELLGTLLILNMNYDRPFQSSLQRLVENRESVEVKKSSALNIVSSLIYAKNKSKEIIVRIADEQSPMGFQVDFRPTKICLEKVKVDDVIEGEIEEENWTVYGYVNRQDIEHRFNISQFLEVVSMTNEWPFS